ncbi:MAG: hypothetical protein KAS76_03055, partial [Thermoplasmatales archaeon]|nr:hypothetical protein [Thermoplasmatales archaeon]
MWKNYDKWNGITATNKHIIEEYCNYRLKVLKKSESTIVNEEKTLRKLTKYFKNKELDKLTDKDLQKIFSDDKFVKKRSTADLHATNTILFYKWMFKLPKNERPKNMYWYEYQKRIDKEKNSNPNKKEEQFITREEYDSIIQNSSHPQNKA